MSDEMEVEAAETDHGPYQHLDEERREIRLLVLKAGSGSDVLQCELQKVFLDDLLKPEYETISYSWGSRKRTSKIIIDGVPTMIPFNTERALHRMRLVDADRVLWVDAVCINQSNEIEKGHQIPFMYTIFTGSRRNLIWLGEDEDGTTGEALKIMDSVLENARYETNDYANFASTIKDEMGTLQVSSRPLTLDSNPEALVRFYSRPWFRRLWVVQEATLAPSNTCICGDYEVPLRDVMRTAAWLHYKRRFFPYSINHKSGIYFCGFLFDLADREFGFYSPFKGHVQMHSLLTSLQQFETLDDRDHIFGLLGLYQASSHCQELPTLLVPDYKKSLAEVLRDATRFTIREIRTLSIFRKQIYTASENGKGRMPSWVPHWHKGRDSKKEADQLPRFFSCDNGRGLMLEEDDDPIDPNVLSVRGLSLESISAVTPVLADGVIKHISAIDFMLGVIHDLLNRHDLMVDTLRLGRTLIASRNSDHKKASERDCLDFAKWTDYTTKENRRLPPTLQQLYNSQNKKYDEDIWRISRYDKANLVACTNRRFFLTTSGRIGIGPRAMQAEDFLCVLFGCKWPVILRPKGVDHELIGICYVDGIMYGEAVQSHFEKGLQDAVFTIR